MKQRAGLSKSTQVILAATGLIVCLTWSGSAAAPRRTQNEPRPFTEDFMLQRCTFTPTGANPFFSLQPGHQLILQSEQDGEVEEVVITVLHDTENISAGALGTVRTRVVEERESLGGELVEVSRNFFAICAETNDVVYFGEDVDIFEDGELMSHEGAWRAGQNGARPGIIMPGTYLLGARYFQELAPGVALDRAENMRMNLAVTVPAGTFENSVMIVETSGLSSSDKTTKFYAPGVGLIVDSQARLVAWHPAE